MIEEKTQSITLKSTPFKDRSKIVQMQSLDLGVISVIVNGISQKKSSLISLTTPFTISDILLTKKRSDLYVLKDSKVINSNLHLRSDLKYLKVASAMVYATLKSQFGLKYSKNIFLLLSKYLENIPINPEGIKLSFLLKLLLINSYIKPSDKCNRCENIALAIDKGESLCLKCANSYSYKFSLDEFQTYLVLSQVRSFKYLKDLEISNSFLEKITYLFKELS